MKKKKHESENSQITYKPWSYEEHERLIEIVKLVGNDPTIISEKLTGRSSREIKQRIKEYRKQLKHNLGQAET